MENIYYSFIITVIAGLSTLIGIIPIFLNIKDYNKLINKALSFASGVMISISIFSLLPESISLLKLSNSNLIMLKIIIFILIGFLISIIINKIFNKIPNKLYKLGLFNMFALLLHNIPEGILTFSSTTMNKSFGTMIALSIICHNIPEGISIAIPIYYSTKSKLKAFLYTLIAGISEPIGGMITYLFLSKYINIFFISNTLLIIIGIMLYIPIYEMLPTAFKYKNKKITLIYLILGIIFMIIFNN